VLYGHWESRLVLVDVSDPASPREMGVYQHDPKTFIQGEVAADGGIACAVAGTNGLDVRNPADPVEVGLYLDAPRLAATGLVVARAESGARSEYFYVANSRGRAAALRFRPGNRSRL
jgi:hypothetical protein